MPRYFVINLAERPERMQAFTDAFAELSFAASIERVDAVAGVRAVRPTIWHSSPGAWGCYVSQLAALLRARQGPKQDYIVVFEDDAIPAANCQRRLDEFLAHVPDDWDMLYLGGQLLKKPPEYINEFVMRGLNINRMHAYAVRWDFLDTVINHLHVSTLSSWRCKHHCDHRLGELHSKHRVYFPAQGWLFGQSAGLSDISGFKNQKRFWELGLTKRP